MIIKPKRISIILFSVMLFFINISILCASSASISVYSSKSKVVVGNTFNVTIKAKSSSYFGTWEFAPSYDKTKFKLISGNNSVIFYGKAKEKSYSYTFKAISSGTGSISVKSVSIRDYDNEKEMSVSKGSTSVTVITQSQLEATYSKNNNLSSLKVEGLKLSPSFSKNTTKYTTEAGANTTEIKIKAYAEDSRSKVSGTGTKDVGEGENKFNITVTAQNGSKKTYTVIVNVVDPNPIEVTIDDIKYTVVKRENSLGKVDGFKKNTTKIDEQEVPCLFNKTNNYTLIGLKNTEGDVSLYLFNSENNTYTKYEDAKLNQMNIFPLELDKTYKPEETRTKITIDDVLFDAIKLSAKGLYIVKARNLDTANDEYYEYDEKTNTLIRYIEEEVQEDNSKDKEISKYKKMLVLLSVETIIVILILICILISKMKKNKRRRLKIEEEKKKQELLKEKEENSKKKKSTKKKEVSKNEKKKNN